MRNGFPTLPVAIGAAALVALVFLFYNGCGAGYSVGSRAGVVTKFSTKGIVLCKSHEGELLMGGLRAAGDGGTQSNVFAFTVNDPNLVAPVEKALASGERVELVYSQYIVSPLCMGSGYAITAVKFPNASTTPPQGGVR